MPKTAPKPKTRRAKALTADHELASRVAAHLDVASKKAASLAEHTVEAVEDEAEKIADAVTHTARETSAQVKKAAAPAIDWFGEGFSRMANAIQTAQTLAQDSVKSLAASRTDATHSAVALQKKLMHIAQSNVADGLEATRKLLAVTNMKDAIAVQSEYAREAAQTLSDQAKELQALSAKLAESAQKPLKTHWARTMDVFKGKSH